MNGQSSQIEGAGLPRSWAFFHGLVRRQVAVERCELCGMEFASRHAHLLDLSSRRLACACELCALLFSGGQDQHYRRVSRLAKFLPDFRMTDAQWDSLQIPINLAFFYRNSLTGRVSAVYPSPAGPAESLLGLEAWAALASDNPILNGIGPDVEALLVNRVGTDRAHYRVSIDLCYELVGLIRTYWTGLSGGAAVWKEVERFFAGLKERVHAQS